MRDRTLNILGFLSQYINRNKDLFYDAEEVWAELLNLGFSEHEIKTAVHHVKETMLKMPGPFWNEVFPVLRSYSPEEMHKLSTKARGFLWRLKCQGVIDHALEDEIVHKVMELEAPAGLKEIKTVAALTVFGYEHKTQAEVRVDTISHLN